MLGSSARFLRLIRFLVLTDFFQNIPTFHKCLTYPPAGGTCCYTENSGMSHRSHASRCPSLAQILTLCPFLLSGRGTPSLQGDFSLPSPPTYWIPSPPTFTGTQTYLLVIPFVPHLYNSCLHGGLPPGCEHSQNFPLKTSRRASEGAARRIPAAACHGAPPQPAAARRRGFRGAACACAVRARCALPRPPCAAMSARGFCPRHPTSTVISSSVTSTSPNPMAIFDSALP